MSDFSKACPRCKADGERPPHFGGNRKCAFESGVFDQDNWNCSTMNALRHMIPEGFAKEQRVAGGSVWNDDEWCGVIPCAEDGGDFLVLGWYKDRGRTQLAAIVSEHKMSPLTVAEAEAILARTYRPTWDRAVVSTPDGS